MKTSAGDWVDVILCNDMLSVADLRSLMPAGMRDVAIVCYFHENQLTYPISEEQERDFQYGMTNITSCLAADSVWFNSRFHRDDFLKAVGGLLRKMPDHVPRGIVDSIRRKSAVTPPPVDVGPRKLAIGKSANEPLRLLWCHRWEYDKNPEPFFKTLLRLDEAGYEFELVLVGEQFRTAPPTFESSWARLQGHVTHAGYLPNREDYLAMLARCDVVISTAIQENFGIAVVEAMLAGCQPLLPNRLSYPELIPVQLSETCLYPSDDALYDRLRAILTGEDRLKPEAQRFLQDSLESRYGPKTTVPALDNALQEVVKRAQGKGGCRT